MGDRDDLQRVSQQSTPPADDGALQTYLIHTGATPELASRMAANILATPTAKTSKMYLQQAKQSNAAMEAQDSKWREFLRPFQEYTQAGREAPQDPISIPLVSAYRTDPGSGRPLQWDQPMMNRDNIQQQTQGLQTQQTAGQLMQGYGLPPDTALKLSAQMHGYQFPPTVPAVQ